MILRPVTNYSINSNNFVQKHSKENQYKSAGSQYDDKNQLMSTFPKSYISFGWCWPHIKAMESLNANFNKAIQKVLGAQSIAKSTIDGKNLFKKTQYSLLDKASAEAATLFSQYCNTQYTVSEMLPSYALSMNKPLVDMMEESDVLNNPINTLISINNVMKLKMKAGIDKNTAKEYTEEQVRKAKAGTQLYTTVMLVEKIKQHVNDATLTEISKDKVKGLTNMIHSAIDSIYGKDTYQRIMNLSKIGENPTLEQKQASVNLIKELDAKAQELTLPEEFKKGLQDLIDYQNNVEGKTIQNSGSGMKDDFALKLSYHTHPHQKINEETTNITQEVHHHEHGPMSEEEHRIFHQQEQMKQRNNGQ